MTVSATMTVAERPCATAALTAGLEAISRIALLVLRAHRRQARALRGISRQALAVQQLAEKLSAPQRLAIEAPRPSLADLIALAAEHGYDVIRRDRED